MKKEPQNKKIVHIVGIILFVGLLAFAIYENIGLTGRSIEVKGQGVSRYPLAQHPKTLQTIVKIRDTNTINSLIDGTGFIALSNELTKAADFDNTMLELVRAFPPEEIPRDQLDIAVKAGKYLAEPFIGAANCFSIIGEKYQGESEAEFIVVTDLIWEDCSNLKEWKLAVMRHRYFTSAGKLLCTHQGKNILLQDYVTAKLSLDVRSC